MPKDGEKKKKGFMKFELLKGKKGHLGLTSYNDGVFMFLPDQVKEIGVEITPEKAKELKAAYPKQFKYVDSKGKKAEGEDEEDQGGG
jgi:hypothetical protein